MNEETKFGKLDNSYKAAGEEVGLKKLAADFYKQMKALPEANVILKMHPKDLTLSIEKLALFLCGWLGGPRKFQEKFGSINIPRFHSHLTVDTLEKEAWLLCMDKALDMQNYSPEFKVYLLTELRVPATRIQELAKSK
jgi:hemoglobin